MEAIVTFATKAALVGDVIAGEEETGGSRKRRIQCVPLFFFLIDVVDVALDVIFSIQLYSMNETLYGSVMLSMVFISVAVWFWSRSVLQIATQKKFDKRTIRRVVIFFEMAMFFIQDATTIFVYISANESYDVGSVGSINLTVTILCGFMVIVSDLCLSCNLKRCCSSCIGCKDVCVGFFNVFCFVWNLVYALAFMILALLVLIAEGRFQDGTIDELYLWTRFWTITTGLWILVVLSNFIILHFSKEVTEEQLSNLGYRLFVFSCFPCCLKREKDKVEDHVETERTEVERGDRNDMLPDTDDEAIFHDDYNQPVIADTTFTTSNNNQQEAEDYEVALALHRQFLNEAQASAPPAPPNTYVA